MPPGPRRGAGWWGYLLPAGLFLLVALPMLATAGAIKQTVEPAACTSCHARQVVAKTDAKDTQKPHPHQVLSCLSCHKDNKIIRDTLVGKVKSDISIPGFKAVKAVSANDKDAKADPKAASAKAEEGKQAAVEEKPAPPRIGDPTCKGCHDMRNHQPKPDAAVRGAHSVHETKGVGCQECHQQVGHGQVKPDGTSEWKKPAMQTCMDCHKKLTKVGTWPPTLVRCPTCHIQNLKPGFHDENWRPWDHGLTAIKMGPGFCDACHGVQKISETKDIVNKGSKDPRVFARNNFWCSGCHLNNRPPRHSDIWRIIHKTQALPGIQYCMVCHNVSKPDATKLQDRENYEERAQQRFWCERCHKPPEGKHPPGTQWIPVHFNYVKSKGIVQGRCFYCHATSHCMTCHTSQTAKPFLENLRQIQEKLNSQGGG